jgi:flagellar hook-associated protein 2
MPGFNSIDGLASGLDTTAIIDAIIQSERRNTVLLEQEQAQKTNIVSSLKALQAKFLALSTEVSRMSRKSTFENYSVNVSDDTYLTVDASGKAGTGSYDIRVLSVARNHQIASQGFTDESMAALGTGSITIQVGDGSAHTIDIDANNNSLVGVRKAINDADIGVTATIINDGSPNNPYRLVLSSEKTGVANRITMSSSLTGSAAYTGAQNKLYTFTVAGTGAQTIGSDSITLDWTDGTNSGSIIVTQADAEVELVGAGADGLNLVFSAGQLTAGDTFQVGTFSPLLQEASDARIAVGSSGGNSSPIVVSSETNTFKNVLAGLNFTIRKETPINESVTVTTDLDVASIRERINEFIRRYNDVNDFIDEQNSYNSETEESGSLFADISVQYMQQSLRRTLGSGISGLDSEFNHLFSVGIRTLGSGSLSITNPSRLEDALRDNLDDVIKLFTSAGTSSSTYIDFITSTAETSVGENLEVDITQAATNGRFQGSGITSPASTALTLNSSNNRLKLTVDGLVSDEIVLTEKTYTSSDELVREIQSKIDSDSRIGNRGLTVEWVTSASSTGYIQLTSSTYGSTSNVKINTALGNAAYNVLGLTNGSGHAGLDVEGTINGEPAEGRGQTLVGKEGNETTEGLKLKITLSQDQLASGVDGRALRRNLTISLTV